MQEMLKKKKDEDTDNYKAKGLEKFLFLNIFR